MGVVIDHDDLDYRKRWESAGANGWNGAFYYSKEIVKYIIPRITTDRNWLTINTYGKCLDHSIVFIHNNLHPENYDWLKRYKDLVLVCGIPETMSKVKHLGTPIYLPLSVKKSDVVKYKVPLKTKEVAFAGRASKRNGTNLPMGCAQLYGLPRTRLLAEMARFKTILAVGRTAIEAKILGCKIGYYDPRFPDPSIWKILDSSQAAKILQKELDKIDGKNDGTK